MPLLAALPAIGASALKYLPAITAVGGAIPGLRRGNLGEAALGAGTGALTGWGLRAPIGGLTSGAVRMAGGMGAQNLLGTAAGQIGGLGTQKAVMGALTPAALGATAGIGIPLAGALGGVGLAGGFSGIGAQGANRALGAGSGIIGYNSITGEPISAIGGAVPPNLGQFGGTNMYGSNPYDIIDPAGPFAANRLMSRKQTETNRDNVNTMAPTLLKWAEETKRRDLERVLAARGITQNIATQAGMLRDQNTAALNQGTEAMRQMGSAVTQQYNYS